ncbi:NFACT family protein [Acidaminococcus sp. NSJ-142]|jgi:predicted ribosome quality control (RQC) complex YloA/Tae2 family protein|uniref:Rqc2 family fibronectin-binding protein n=1 Tax=Acidaminococcus TaxID=904 RepID=UPI000CFA7CC6|nr:MULTISPECIES: NFACT family protein [Acidaminococcus]MCD2434918.1 NFACT family protein [Acidaminococcus hominis]MCH4096053.1 NFACT family protein [Acidaminococcus provencensis]RHK02297.1 fibronectin-binding domain-containing protein [Acidaminococcus sp. AM05-11]
MNLEGITLQVLTQELSRRLLGGKIFKIFMPGKSSLLLQINTQNHTENLLVDMGGDTPLITLPQTLPERPDLPPSFCMLLRKHLEEGRITKISQQGLDRIITLSVDSIGAERKIITKRLVLELTGKNSNIIFVNEQGIILDALRHIGKFQSRVRQILPNQPYAYPPAQDGLDFLQTSPHALREAVTACGDLPLEQALISATQGIGRYTAQEVLLRAGISGPANLLELTQAQQLEKALAGLQAEIGKRLDGTDSTVIAQIDSHNRMKNLVPYVPQTHPEWTQKPFASLLEAQAYSASLVPVQIPDKDLLTKLVVTQEAKVAKKLKFLAQDLAKAENAEEQKIMADTLMAYGWQVKKGQTSCELPNIYDSKPMKISLSPSLNPMENAQAYYKKYNKFKRAVGEIKLQQQEAQDLLTYLQSLDASLDTAVTKGEIGEIKQEIIQLGLLPSSKKRVPTQSKSEPLKIVLSPETTLYIGKNNKQNDYVTFKLGRGKDLWFHAKNIPGSHVILKTTLPQPREEDILMAASLAAGYSKGKNSDRVAVDCAEKHLVKKPSGAKPGFVIYTGQKTLYVHPRTSLKG